MIDQLTFDELRAYQSGQLNGPARYRVERLLLENPFYADALAGLEAMQQSTTSAQPTAEQLADLRDALHERIHASANQKTALATLDSDDHSRHSVHACHGYLLYFLCAEARPKTQRKTNAFGNQQSPQSTASWNYMG